MRTKLAVYILTATVVLLAGAGVHNIQSKQQKLEVQKVELQSTSTKLKTLELKYQKLDQQLDQKNADVDKLDKQRQQLDKDKQDLQAQLQAKIEAKQQAQIALDKAKLTSTASAGAVNTGGINCKAGTGEAKAFIYFCESGNNPASVNGSGCRGLGQACPGSKLPCGVDYACQDAYFTSYMQSRYGTWESAKAAWLSRCDTAPGCWW